MVLASFTAVLIVLTCMIVWRVRLGELEMLRRDESGLLRVELRRRLEMRSHADGLGGQSFPEPIETRMLVWQVCSLPVWMCSESIGLPSSCESRIDDLRPEDFDRHFTPAFRLTSRPIGEPRRSPAATA